MGKKRIAALAAAVVVMAAVSAVLLLLLSAVTWKLNLPEQAVRIAVRVIYLISCLAGGIFIGKQMREKKYLWGIAAGCIYYFLLIGLSVFIGGGVPEAVELLAAFMLTVPAGMAGGMVG